LVKLARLGEGTCWYATWGCACAGGCGDEVICWLRPEAVRDGIWRIARLLGDCSAGDARAGCGGGVSRAGESCGESSELMSMLAALYVAERR
jgi:hypothetical protein